MTIDKLSLRIRSSRILTILFLLFTAMLILIGELTLVLLIEMANSILTIPTIIILSPAGIVLLTFTAARFLIAPQVPPLFTPKHDRILKNVWAIVGFLVTLGIGLSIGSVIK